MGAVRQYLNDLLSISLDTSRLLIATGGRSMGIRTSAIAGFAAITLYAGQATADICSDPQDQVAVRVKTLQAELMVAALRCNSDQHYNTFVHKFESDLVVQGAQLRKYFSRAFGPESEFRLNKFVTYLANAASLRSIGMGKGYCDSANTLFATVMDREIGELAAYAATQRVDVASEAPVCQRVAALIER